MSPKIGRPHIENPKTDRFNIRATPEEKKEILHFSKESGIGLLELLKIGIDSVKSQKK